MILSEIVFLMFNNKLNEDWFQKQAAKTHFHLLFKTFRFEVSWLLSAGRFGHDINFDRLAEGNRSFDGGLCWWEAVDAVAPSWLNAWRGRGWRGAVGQQEAHLNLWRLWVRERQRHVRMRCFKHKCLCVCCTDLSRPCGRGKPEWWAGVCSAQAFWSQQVWDGSHDFDRLDTGPLNGQEYLSKSRLYSGFPRWKFKFTRSTGVTKLRNLTHKGFWRKSEDCWTQQQQ